MRIIRILHKGMSFYARVTEDGLQCLDKAKGVEGIISPDQATLLPLAVPSKIISIEASKETASAQHAPNIQFRPPSSIIGGGIPVLIPAGAEQATATPTLGILIGRQCKDVAADDIASYIFGYTCANNIMATVPGLAPEGTPATYGFDTFAPIGPYLETEIATPTEIDLIFSVNDEVKQTVNLEGLSLSPFDAISRASSIMTLYPGDVVFFNVSKTALSIADGDTISVEIPGLGLLSNPVKVEKKQPHVGSDTAATRVQ